jgi:hypothetical protein
MVNRYEMVSWKESISDKCTIFNCVGEQYQLALQWAFAGLEDIIILRAAF